MALRFVLEQVKGNIIALHDRITPFGHLHLDLEAQLGPVVAKRFIHVDHRDFRCDSF